MEEEGLRKKKGCLGLVLFSSVMCSLNDYRQRKSRGGQGSTYAKLRPMHTTLPACFRLDDA